MMWFNNIYIFASYLNDLMYLAEKSAIRY